MTRVVVTGAAGFLGSHLITLLRTGFDVVATSRGSHAGILRVAAYSEIPDGDVLIHLAGESDRAAMNLGGTAFVEERVHLTKALGSRFEGRVIYASSGVVYGDKGEQPYGPDAPVFAVDAYSRAKLQEERVVLDAGGTVVRLANLYGAGMSPGNVMSDILRQTPGEGPLKVRDDAPVRDFLAVSDAAAAFVLLAGMLLPGILNVGSGIGTSIRCLAETALVLAGDGEREIVATQPSSQRSINVLDIAATTKALGWGPSLSLKEHMSELFYSGRVS